MSLGRSLALLLTLAAALLSGGCAEHLASYEGQSQPLTAAATGLSPDAMSAARPREKPGVSSRERIALHLSAALSPHERTQVMTAINDWNAALNGVIRFAVVTDNQTLVASSFWRVRVVRGSAGPQSANGGTPLAVTFRPWIGHGVVRIYADNLKTSDLAAVMRHELGHVLGLDHDAGGLMAAQYSDWAMQCIDERTISVLAARRHLPVSALRWCN